MTAAAQSRVLHELQQADGRVQAAIRYITPRNGITLAYALDDARDEKGICVSKEGSVGFGIDEAVSRVVITVRRFNSDIKAAGCIRYTEEIAETTKEIFLDVEEYDINKYPKGISTMDWGVAFICKEGVPMAICARNGEAEDGSSIYILGETPDDVASRILIISERLTL